MGRFVFAIYVHMRYSNLGTIFYCLVSIVKTFCKVYTHLLLLLQTEGKDEEGLGTRQVLGYVDLMPHLCNLLSFKMTSEYIVHT